MGGGNQPVPIKEKLPFYLKMDRIKPTVVTVLLLFIVGYLMDFILYRLGVQGAETISNDLVIGVFGGAAVWYYLAATRERHNLARARERLALVTELNYHIRNALTVIGHSATLEDAGDRSRLVEEAVKQIDEVLTGLAPSLGSPKGPPLSRSEQRNA